MPTTILRKIALLFATALLGSGCVHYHSALREKQAADTIAKTTALAAAQDGLYDEMLANVSSISATNASLTSAADRRKIEILSQQVLGMQWTALADSFGVDPDAPTKQPGILANQQATYKAVEARLSTSLERAGIDLEKGTDLLKAAKDALEAAQKDLTRWNRNVAAYTAIIELLPQTAVLTEVKDGDSFKQTAEKLADEFSSKKITYADAEGKTESTTLGKVAGEIFSEAKKRDGNGRVTANRQATAAHPPGGMVIMAALAKDLAELQRDEAIERIQALQSVSVTLDEAANALRLLSTFATTGANDARSLAASHPNETVSTTLVKNAIPIITEGKPGTAVPNPAIIAEGYQPVACWTFISGWGTTLFDRLEEESAETAHYISITSGRAASRQHQAIVARSVEMLGQYHRGGVRPEKVAELVYRITELSIFASIAGKMP